MKTLLRTPIGEIEDKSILHAVQDFCEMFNWRETDYQDYSFFEFLEVIIREHGNSISLDKVGVPQVLDRKLENLRDDGIYQVCRELKNDDTSQLRGELTLFAFLKDHLAALAAPVKEPRRLSDPEFRAKLIRQKRENGSL